ncbi:hypothetical protein BMS3Bbin09_00106 [bacterium BMS3Bbin09]|nr:hypothetical protein BMS3Bbin09_00106 [bacterium BMS3Bbin09]
MVFREFVECFVERARHLRDVLHLFRGKIIKVLVYWLSGIDLVLYPVDSCHEHCRECEVRVT